MRGCVYFLREESSKEASKKQIDRNTCLILYADEITKVSGLSTGLPRQPYGFLAMTLVYIVFLFRGSFFCLLFLLNVSMRISSLAQAVYKYNIFLFRGSFFCLLFFSNASIRISSLA